MYLPNINAWTPQTESSCPGQRSQFLAHLGAKHRLVERFISLEEIEAEVPVKDVAQEADESEEATLRDADIETEEATPGNADIDEMLDITTTAPGDETIDEDINDDCDDVFKTADEELPGHSSWFTPPQRKK